MKDVATSGLYLRRRIEIHVDHNWIGLQDATTPSQKTGFLGSRSQRREQRASTNNPEKHTAANGASTSWVLGMSSS